MQATMAKPTKVTRILHSRALNRSKYDRLVEIAALCGRVRGDAWQRCSGWSTAQQSPRAIRDDWMAEGYDWRGLPARLGRATLLDALGDIHACREAAKVPVRKAVWRRTEGDEEERHRLYALLQQNRWTEDSFLHRHMRKRWKGGTSRVKNQIVLEPGTYTAKVRHGRAWVHMQGMERGQRIAIPLREKHTPSGQLRILLQDDGQVEVHYSVNEEDACSTHPGGSETVGVDKGYTEAYTDSEGERHGPGLGDLLAAESDARKVKGQRRNRMRDLEQKHRDAGNVKKADNILRHNLGHRKWDRRQKQHNCTGQGLPVPGRPQHRRPRRHHRLRGSDGIHEVGQEGHAPRHPTPSERLGQGRDGRHPNLDISTQKHCVGVGEPRLHVANRLPHRTPAGKTALGPVLRPGRSRVGRGHQRRPQHPGAHVRRRDHAVHALPRGQAPAPGSKRDNGGDGSTRTRVRQSGASRLTAESELPQTHKV